MLCRYSFLGGIEQKSNDCFHVKSYWNWIWTHLSSLATNMQLSSDQGGIWFLFLFARYSASCGVTSDWPHPAAISFCLIPCKRITRSLHWCKLSELHGGFKFIETISFLTECTRMHLLSPDITLSFNGEVVVLSLVAFLPLKHLLLWNLKKQFWT